MFVKNNSSEIRISAFPYHSPIARLGRAESVCAMTSHGDAIGKMSSFASRADSFVNAALDQLDDAVEQAFVGDGNSDEVAKLNAAAMTPAQTALLKTTSSLSTATRSKSFQPALYIVLYPRFPESPRWLVMRRP